MHRDIVITNQSAILRWIDQLQDELSVIRGLLDGEFDEERKQRVTQFFEKARDIRAEWATQVTREGELLQQTGSELSMEGVGDQMSRMFFGGLFKRRMAEADRLGRKQNRRGGVQGKRDQSGGNS